MAGMQNFLTFREAPRLGPCAEFPMLPESFDPQHHLSYNDVAQPFYLVCEKDTVLAQMSGEGRLHLRHSNVRYHDLRPGDWLYIPAGTPNRFVPTTPSVQYRLRARQPGLEAVAFFADDQDGPELFRHVWDTRESVSQQEYLKACERFNCSPELRTDPRTGAIAEPIDIAPFKWAELAERIAMDSEQSSSEGVV